MWVIPDYQAEVQVLSGGLYLYLESNNQKQFRDSLTSAGALEGTLGELGALGHGYEAIQNTHSLVNTFLRSRRLQVPGDHQRQTRSV